MQGKHRLVYLLFLMFSKSAAALMLITIITSCSILSSSNLSQSTEAKSALTQLKRLESEIEIGISKADYTKEVKELKFDIEQFDETKASQNNSDFTERLNSAIKGHLMVLELWEHGLSGNCHSTSRYEKQPPDLCSKWEDSDVLASAINKYPETRTIVDKLGKEYFDSAIERGYSKAETPENYIFYDAGPGIDEDITNRIVQVIWQHTKEDTAQASTTMLK